MTNSLRVKILDDLRDAHRFASLLCSPDVARRLGYKVDRLVEADILDTPLAAREFLQRGIWAMHDMIRAIELHHGLR